MLSTRRLSWTLVRSLALASLCFATSCTEPEPPDIPDSVPTEDEVETEGEAGEDDTAATQPSPEDRPMSRPADDDRFAERRREMVRQQLAVREIENERVLEAMRRVPRHEFVPSWLRGRAYDDGPLPIGHDQTISQPYIVALMTQLADPQAGDRALDVGTGSGYQAAVLAELTEHVYSIEIVEPLAEEARELLERLGYDNVTVRHGDGYRGWESKAPFDVIILAAAPDHVPQPLIDQLAPGGKLVLPVGGFAQELLLIEKDAEGNVTRRSIAPVAFVPMTGEAKKD